ncbi:unnamed protein product [Menidia menidia]|uniref:(Atlantic silverside) hypothetical protein n=1 Tax=Menidia menidia TaxID=238744 RepID=A0A8S4B0J6_9TELE|nr:unnamed protein product [Menidia menidia]
MMGRLLQTMVLLWVVQAAHAGGYGVKAGPTNGQQMKGYGAQTGGNGGEGTRGNGGNPAVLPNGNGGKSNGRCRYGVKAGPTNGQQLKGYGAQSGGNGGQATGYGVKAGPTNGQLKGYGAQAHGNEGQGTKGYGSGPQAGGNGGGLGTKGYNGGYGSAGSTLGPHYGNGGMKGPIQGYEPPRQGAVRPQPGYGNGAVPHGYGSKPRGYGAGTGIFKGYGTQANGHSVGNGATLGGNGVPGPSSGSKGVGAPSQGYGTVQNGKGQATQGADVFSGKSYKGGALSPQQHVDTPVENVSPQHETAQGEVPDAPEPTSGILVMVTQEKYQKLPPPVAQGKNYKKSPLIHEATPEPVPVLPEGGEPDHLPEPAPMGPKDKGQKGATTVPVVPQSSPVSEPEAESNEDVSISKGQGPKQAKPDCGPDGQWMKIPRPGYAGSADGYSNGGGGKTNKPGYGAGGNVFPGQSNGYGAGLGYHYGGKPVQPGYGQGAYPPVRYGNGNSYGGYGQGYRAGPQPDFASFGQGVPPADAKSGGAKQLPFNGAPVVPAGLDGMSQFEPQSADLGPNGNVGSMYGGVGGLPFGGQALGMGAEKSNTKYGESHLEGLEGCNLVGSLSVQAKTVVEIMVGFGVNSYMPAGDGKSHGKYGHGGFPNGGQLPGGNGNAPGYGRLPYEVQQAGLSPEAKSTGQYALPGSPFQPEPAGFGPNKKSTAHYGGREVPYTPQTLGFGGGAKSGKHDKQVPYQSQPLESATEGVTGLTEPDSTEQHYVRAEVPTPGVESEEPIDAYDNVGYINGQVQPEGPAAPTVSTTLENQFVPVESLIPDKLPAEGVHGPESTTSLHEAEPAAESQGEAQVPEQPDDLQQLPRQIHIQQHLKLHFHPQGKSWRWGKNGKYDLNGFFGNSGYQG